MLLHLLWDNFHYRKYWLRSATLVHEIISICQKSPALKSEKRQLLGITLVPHTIRRSVSKSADILKKQVHELSATLLTSKRCHIYHPCHENVLQQ